jgi:hypothetical protein
VRLFSVGQLLLSSSGVFCEGLMLLLLEDQAIPENHFEYYYYYYYYYYYFLPRRRNRHRYALELMIPYR